MKHFYNFLYNFFLNNLGHMSFYCYYLKLEVIKRQQILIKREKSHYHYQEIDQTIEIVPKTRMTASFAMPWMTADDDGAVSLGALPAAQR